MSNKPKGEGRPGRPPGPSEDSNYLHDAVIVYEDGSDKFADPLPVQDRRTKSQKASGVRAEDDIKAMVRAAFHADSPEEEGGMEWLLKIRLTNPKLFGDLVKAALPSEAVLVEGLTKGPLHFLETVMNNEALDVKIRKGAADSMLSDRNRINAVSNLLISDIFRELKSVVKNLPATEENMGDFIDRLQYYSKHLVDEAMKSIQLTNNY